MPQDGHHKQDCELVAGKRWITAMAPRYRHLGITLLADSRYAVHPFVELVTAHEMDFIFVSKPSEHKHLYEDMEFHQKLGNVAHIRRQQWTGKARQWLTYRYLNEVDLGAKQDTIKVNWAGLTVTDHSGQVTAQYAFITNHQITHENVEELIQAGRCRWKIENENNNTLKTKGYHFEHNFGHGKKHLSTTLSTLNLLAFLFHTVLQLTDIQCAQLRQALPRRDTFFQHIGTLTQYLCFASWDSLLAFMIRALKQGPAAPAGPVRHHSLNAQYHNRCHLTPPPRRGPPRQRSGHYAAWLVAITSRQQRHTSATSGLALLGLLPIPMLRLVQINPGLFLLSPPPEADRRPHPSLTRCQPSPKRQNENRW